MAKTDEEKAADAAQAEQEAEAKRLADAAEKDAEEHKDRVNLSALAEAEAKAAADAVPKAQAEEQEKRRKAAEDSKEFGGQVVSTDNYSAVATEHLGRSVLEIRPAGWVGEGFVIPSSRVAEVKELLGKVKNLPKADKKEA